MKRKTSNRVTKRGPLRVATLVVATAVMCCTVAAGCGSSPSSSDEDERIIRSAKQIEQNRAEADSIELPDILAYVPSDTPYLFGLLQPMTSIEKIMYAAKLGIDDLVFAFDDVITDQDFAVLREIFENPQRYVVYGLGIFPVIRLEVTNPEDVLRTVKSVAERNLNAAPVEIGKATYWLGQFDGVGYAFGMEGGMLVATVATADAIKPIAEYVFSGEKPEDSMANGRVLKDLFRTYGLRGRDIGIFDTQAFFETLFGGGAELNRSMMDFAKNDEFIRAIRNRKCQNAIAEISLAVPKIIMGQEVANDTQVTNVVITELGDSARTELDLLRVSPEGVGWTLPEEGILSLGVAIDGRAALDLGNRIVGTFAEIAEICTVGEKRFLGGSDFRRGNNKIPGMPSGGIVVLESVEMEPKFSFSGYGMISVESVRTLLIELGISNKDMKLNGVFQSSPVPTPWPIKVAFEPKRIFFSSGGGGLEEKAKKLAGKFYPTQPFVSIYINGKRFSEVETMLEEQGFPQESRMSPEVNYSGASYLDETGLIFMVRSKIAK